MPTPEASNIRSGRDRVDEVAEWSLQPGEARTPTDPRRSGASSRPVPRRHVPSEAHPDASVDGTAVNRSPGIDSPTREFPIASDLQIACTLSAWDYRSRLAEIAALSRDALRHVERHGHTFILRYAPEAATRVRQLVEQERRCCAFLQFDLQESADEVRLLVTAPPAAAEVVPELLAELTGRQG